MVSFAELPEDNVLDVLHRLPSKSLAKFKCVSRRWRKHISGPSPIESCRSRRWRPTPRVVGLFFQNMERHRVAPIHFLSTAKESEELGYGGDLDESVDFLGRRTIIVASSNGFLLCNPKRKCQKEYYIYNPATRQWISLPKVPPKYYREVTTGFACKTDDPCKDSISYKVVRCVIPQEMHFLDTVSTVTIQTLSSETGKWMTIHLTPDVPRPFLPAMYPPKLSAVVIDDVFYWLAMGPRIVAFDMVERRFRSIYTPDGGGFSARIATVNGLLHYGSSDFGDIKIWALEGDYRSSTAQWHMKHSVSFVTLANRHPDFFDTTGGDKRILVVEFHSADPRIVYLFYRGKLISYNTEDGVVEVVEDLLVRHRCCILDCNFFPYEWHEWPRLL